MANVYQTGSFYNEMDLWQKLDPLILAAGWTIRSSISDGYDRVYTSTGEDGYAVNYVRMAARQQDLVRENSSYSQRLNADGYSGFVNFFAYQHFPVSGLPIDGYGEIGRFGPTMYYNSSSDIRRFNMVVASPSASGSTDLIANATVWPGSERWDADGNSGYPTFDGNRYLYFMSNGGSLRRFNVSTGSTSTPTSQSQNNVGGGITYVESRDRYYMVAGTQSGTPGFQVLLYEFNFNDVLTNVKYVQNNSWNSSSVSPKAVGYKQFIYMFQGSNGTAVGRYDILNDSWTAITTTNTITTYGGSAAIFATRQETGFTKHRIYHIGGAGGSSMRYINVEDDGSIVDASWTSVAGTPFAQGSNTGSLFEWDGYQRIIYGPAGNGSTLRELYRYDMIGNVWTLVNSNFFPSTVTGSVVNMSLHYALQSRVKADYYKLNQKYWFFGDRDRIIVITKDQNGFYSYCYAGAIESYYNNVTKATTTANITAGVNVIIPVNNTSQFSIGERVQIQGPSPTDFFTNTGLDQRIRKFIKTEHITITAINAGVSITVTVLNNSYTSGSKLASDIQNTVVTTEGTRWAQALNKPNTSNSYASGDPAEQYYVLQPAVTTAFTTLTDLNKRTNQFTLWPFVLANENVTNFSGKEVRGQLKGVFCSSTGTGVSEDIIQIGANQYIVFTIARQEDTRNYVFGPIV